MTGSGALQRVWAVAVETDTQVPVDAAFLDRFGAPSAQARYDVSIPRSHQVGRLEWPGPGTAPEDSLFIADQENLDSDQALFDDIARQLGPGEEIGVFIHGYNTTYPEALYRHAQIAFDYGMTGPQVTLVWPSKGQPLGYLADRDRVMIARDGTLRFLDRLAARFPGQVVVTAHSMGALLTMEVLRQAALTGSPLSDRLAGLVLVSPDVGIDVFLAQTRHPDTLPAQATVIVSQSDRLLGLSERLAGGQPRLGEGNDIDRLESLDIVVIDISDAPGGDLRKHSTAMTSPTAISFLRALTEDETVLSEEAGSGLLLLQFGSLL